jgi:hypothetical protein
MPKLLTLRPVVVDVKAIQKIRYLGKKVVSPHAMPGLDGPSEKISCHEFVKCTAEVEPPKRIENDENAALCRAALRT